MSILYINENGAVIGIEGNRCVVKYPDGMLHSIPIEALESITIMSNSQITAQCVRDCIDRGIPITYFSKGGRYFGRVVSTGHVNTNRQRMQCSLYNSEFAIQLSKRIIHGKLKNQAVVLKRYGKSTGISVDKYLTSINICRGKLEQCNSISEIMGFEGQAAKSYFAGLAEVILPEFAFSGRNKRPPRDEFNSMISLGYSVLMNEIVAKIEIKGLNPYFGFMHQDSEKHPTLASDLMEEWRAVIVDSTVMSMINGCEIQKTDFMTDVEEPGCYLTRDGVKKYLVKLDRKLNTEVKYLEYLDFSVSFRNAILYQISSLVKAMENNDASMYKPIEIR